MRRMRLSFVWLSLSLVALAGCLGQESELQGESVDAPVVDGFANVRQHDLVVRAPGLAQWGGVRLEAGDHSDENLCLVSCVRMDCAGAECVPDACPEASCVWYTFEVDDPGPGRELSAALRFPTDRTIEMRAWLVDAEGQGIAELDDSGFAFSVAKSVVVRDVTPGAYAVAVYQTRGTGTHELAVRWQSPGAATEGLVLPDLVTMPPTDLTFERPPEGIGAFTLPRNPVVSALAEAVAGPGCTLEEHRNAAPTKCLRFTNAVGNGGQGPLKLTLSPVDAATFATSGRWAQQVLHEDGSWREHRAGPTEFHVAHAHWHDAVSNRYVVYPVDGSGVRGDELGVGRKTGVCFADIGLVALDVPRVAVPVEDGMGCFVADTNGYHTGLTPGWYDSYPWLLADQFVDMGDAPDGVYELCTVSNAEGTLLESDLDNNEACTRFRMTGVDIEVMDPPPYHKETENGWI